MTRFQLVAFVIAAAVSTAAQAEIKKGAKAASEARPDDVVCTYERSVGSNLKRRVCATRAAREEARRQDQEAMRHRSTRGSANTDPTRSVVER